MPSNAPTRAVALAFLLASPRAGWLLVLLLAPLLLFPTVAPWLTLTATAGYLLALALARGYGRPSWVRSPLDAALALLLAMVAVATVISPIPALSAPKLAGIVLGVLVYRATLLAVVSPTSAAVGAAVYLLALLGLLAPGLLGTAWLSKVPGFPGLGSHLPRVVQHLPGTAAEGVHPNAIGATTLLALPGLVVVLTSAVVMSRRARSVVRVHRPASRRRTASLAALAILTAALSGILLVSQSRTAWLAMALTLAVLAAVASKAARLVLALTTAVAASVVLAQWGQVSAWLATDAPPVGPSALSTVTLHGRLEVWSRALFAIEDFPLTGMGLNTFRRVVHVLYPLFLTSPDFDIAHAHNVFLQTALDVGLPGLVAYVALLMLTTVMAWQVWAQPDSPGAPPSVVRPQTLALACWANLLAIHCWGLGDAVVLGAKVGVFVWFSIGLIVALHRVTVVGPATHTGGTPEPTANEESGR